MFEVALLLFVKAKLRKLAIRVYGFRDMLHCNLGAELVPIQREQGLWGQHKPNCHEGLNLRNPRRIYEQEFLCVCGISFKMPFCKVWIGYERKS
ncbi:hypothetical protein AAZX31_02G108600 [Glycine max]|uniref:Uncharacterized protein n=1 Tax=Glycine max TaxID=3847 RepID=K7K7S0_SOYBN|nr:uncharacterized protein LOC100796665 [Glycine max]XP_025980008.1 uncharacterized protein LOC100796665 isoform X1 [Glycine max]KAH1059864.1 hypothetical protein GYH30_003718 [Glycine max]KAH1059865.1 hypothetical protein GYH30_003718 [Glycine max]KRH70855.1 hypothetical protein GLYMA_02G114100v4 [Glycine max]KRH70856.1 hypothetical protein GLYMA_02G114100v4 [Glycine max]|eukprot:NP_001351571.1 uncharacterized protein LOC100796665 [Glycine max]